MSVKNISSAILGVGVDDTTIDLFESQYPVPTGVSYNSYVIRDEKTAILDTVDARATDEWMANVTEALAGEKPAYLVVHHMEPDHGANVARLAALYPEMHTLFSRFSNLLLRSRLYAFAERKVLRKRNTFGGAVNRRSPKNAFSEAASIFGLRQPLRGLKGASSPFLVGPARRNRWWFSGSLLTSKENNQP